MHDAIYVFHAFALNRADPGNILNDLTLSSILLMCLSHVRSTTVRAASLGAEYPSETCATHAVAWRAARSQAARARQRRARSRPPALTLIPLLALLQASQPSSVGEDTVSFMRRGPGVGNSGAAEEPVLYGCDQLCDAPSRHANDRLESKVRHVPHCSAVYLLSGGSQH